MTKSPIVVLDVETTGKERSTDQIIELCLQLGLAPGSECRVWRIRPTVPIHPEAQAVHGITAADLAASPMFDAVAPEIVEMLAAADVIVGYSVAFDLDIVQAELTRVRMPPLDLQGKHVVDVLRLWHHVEPRTLVAAHEKFCGAPLADAHAARVDVGATAQVLTAMLETFGLVGKSWPELAAIADPFPGRENWIGPSHHLQWNDRGEPVFAFGKNKGCRIDEIDPGFLHWILGKDFPPHVKDICRQALLAHGEKFTAWIIKRYPRATQS